jgi:hypothetical protein
MRLYSFAHRRDQRWILFMQVTLGRMPRDCDK